MDGDGFDFEIDLASLVGDAVELAPDVAFVVFIETAAAHRDRALAKGFSPEAAESMSVALHSGLVALYFTSVQ